MTAQIAGGMTALAVLPSTWYYIRTLTRLGRH